MGREESGPSAQLALSPASRSDDKPDRERKGADLPSSKSSASSGSRSTRQPKTSPKTLSKRGRKIEKKKKKKKKKIRGVLCLDFAAFLPRILFRCYFFYSTSRRKERKKERKKT
ncbi:hypothetical protein AAFF_G00435340 [Aldrovandia affinis]|uniref:Uncharacterized protein n=1 Tax=Aldrovandia affinis TaxID=143900 RepID=A0AAD7WIG0_9TELE|nr:hypothetical protein AAFF_G00435340 [Aldrovandia affinis]